MKDFGRREFGWTRLAVTPEQFGTFDIIPLAPKKQDRHYRAFQAEFGELCAEVEAVPAPALRTMVREAIERHVPQEDWKRLTNIERAERESWRKVMDKMRGGCVEDDADVFDTDDDDDESGNGEPDSC